MTAACGCPAPARPVPASVMPELERSLASVGGVYDFVAAAVAHQGGHQ